MQSIIYSETDLTVWQMSATSDYRAFLRSQLGPVEFGINEHGKPRIVDSRWHFNASHSGELMLLALSSIEVGIDIERVRPIVHLDHLAAKYFPGEPIGDRDSFCRAWVRREALLKAHGIGIRGLSTHRDLPAGWRLIDLPVPSGYYASLVQQA